ncbi:MAG: nicotinate phosphoribosyltransferase, partial [Gammaproteobacteria bacterium]|nr:nicotinate phosphoribosyltransferase [Gammaproteobacteria bacterium]
LIVDLFRKFRWRCMLEFGIGTNFPNVLCYNPLQIVIKMTRCYGQPVTKLTDTPEKNTCDDENYVAYLRQVFNVPVNKLPN